jgi:hypothetical protein
VKSVSLLGEGLRVGFVLTINPESKVSSSPSIPLSRGKSVSLLGEGLREGIGLYPRTNAMSIGRDKGAALSILKWRLVWKSDTFYRVLPPPQSPSPGGSLVSLLGEG